MYFPRFSACYLQKTRKWMPSTLYWETKGLYKNLYNESFIVSQKSQGKKRKNLSLWRNRITLPKTCILSLLIMLPMKTLKYMERTLCLGKERTLRETCIMSVFKFLN